ncbi:hypothetical protein ABZ608_41490 [Streptomyces sp. NPDC013172]|uniref:Uncharacterized protein n=1 Tax=Streptomyces atriruber TaxID=545121 RepID=A0ABV3C2D2_9ACTN
MKSKQEQVENYERGAAECRDLQLSAEQAGNHHLARLHGEAVNANLDAINHLNSEDNF